MRSLVIAAAAAVICGIGAGAHATELVGKPVKAASAKSEMLAAAVTPNDKGGFAVFTATASGKARSFNALTAQFFGADRKPDGKAFRFDTKIKNKKPLSFSLFGAARLGSGKIITPYQAYLPGESRPSYVAQLFEKGDASGKPTVVVPSFNYPYRAIGLMDGRALLTFQPVSGFQQFGFVEKNGDVPKTFRSFTTNYNDLVPLDDGFLRPYTSGDEPATLIGQIYSGKGKPEREIQFLTRDRSTLIPFNRVVGLTGGEIVLLVCDSAPDFLRCDITGQKYSRAGKKLGDPVVLVRDVSSQRIDATFLPNGGLFLSYFSDAGGSRRVVDAAFDKTLKLKGAVDDPRPLGSRSGGLTPLTDGRVAVSYYVGDDATDFYVQIVKPPGGRPRVVAR